MSKFFAILAGLVSIFAGIYLASIQSAASNSLISTIANGMGWYYIARGLYMISMLYQEGKINTPQVD
jgi:hypothetical protein